MLLQFSFFLRSDYKMPGDAIAISPILQTSKSINKRTVIQTNQQAIFHIQPSIILSLQSSQPIDKRVVSAAIFAAVIKIFVNA